MPSIPQNRAQQTRQAILDQQDRLVAALRLARGIISLVEQDADFMWHRGNQDFRDAVETIDALLVDFEGEDET